MAVVAFFVFASALAASVAVFWLTLAPAMPRIVALLRDGADTGVDMDVGTGAPRATAWTVSEPRLRERVRTVTVAAHPKWREAA